MTPPPARSWLVRPCPDLGGTGGNLVATSGGVWGTVGIGMTEWVWFAPNGDLSQVVRVSQGAGAGLDSVPDLQRRRRLDRRLAARSPARTPPPAR